MIERRALGIARVRMLAVGAGVEGDIGGVAAEVDRMAAIARGAAPAFVPAEDRRQYARGAVGIADGQIRSEEHTSELQSLMRSSSAVFCLKKKTKHTLLASPLIR